MAASDASNKDAGAMLTIGELGKELGLPTHILRYWETKFSQLRPLQRSGNRRYYRPEDVALAQKINALLNERGFTIKGAQQELAKGAAPALAPAAVAPATARPATAMHDAVIDVAVLRSIRDRLKTALASA